MNLKKKCFFWLYFSRKILNQIMIFCRLFPHYFAMFYFFKKWLNAAAAAKSKLTKRRCTVNSFRSIFFENYCGKKNIIFFYRKNFGGAEISVGVKIWKQPLILTIFGTTQKFVHPQIFFWRKTIIFFLPKRIWKRTTSIIFL